MLDRISQHRNFEFNYMFLNIFLGLKSKGARRNQLLPDATASCASYVKSSLLQEKKSAHGRETGLRE